MFACALMATAAALPAARRRPAAVPALMWNAVGVTWQTLCPHNSIPVGCFVSLAGLLFYAVSMYVSDCLCILISDFALHVL